MREAKLGAHGVLLKRIEDKQERVTMSGIIIPSTKKETRIKGIVVHTGSGTLNKPMEVSKDEIILYDSLAVVPVEIDGDNFDLIDSSEIIHILQ